MMNFKNEEAVSPVIGVILMVAITVILAAVIAAFVFGMTGDMPGATKNVVMTPKLVVGGGETDAGVADSYDGIRLQIQGGSIADIKSLTKLRINVTSTADAPTVTPGDGLKDAGTDIFEIEKPNELGIGTTLSVKLDQSAATDGPFEVTVIGIFSDGGEQMLVKPTRV